MKGIKFVSGKPALYIYAANALVIGDLHLGVEIKLEKEGIHFAGVSVAIAKEINDICSKTNADKLILLGDIKESVSYPTADEFNSIKSFFENLEGIDITVIKGNHDGHIGEIMKRIEESVKVEKELAMGGITFIHGNALPSASALHGDYIVMAHGHVAIESIGRKEKVFMVAPAGKEAGSFCKDYNPRIKLIVMPAFSPLITGTGINGMTKSNIPLLNRGIFDFNNAEIYSLVGKKIGKVCRLVR